MFLPKLLTPFTKQCFVVVSAAINLGQLTLVLAIIVALIPQLKASHSSIPSDDDSTSWIASMPGITQVLGSIFGATLMEKLGRKKANILNNLLYIISWICIIFANSLVVMLIARALQGIAVGLSICLTPVTIGESTSPKNRGSFTVAASCIQALFMLVVHAVGSYLSWRTVAIVCTCITAGNFVLSIFLPETPSWLAKHGKYEECREVFRWLRGDDEEDELAKLIEASKEENDSRSEKRTLKENIEGICSTLRKKEFYKPLIIMIHLYTLIHWAGINCLTSFLVDLVNTTVGKYVNTPAVVMSLGIQRFVSCFIAVLIIRKLKRRTMLFMTVGLNVAVLLASAGYIHAKEHNMLPFDHPAIGGLMVHLLMIMVGAGSLPMPFVIAGEIFSLAFRSMSSGITLIIFSLNLFLSVKTFPFLLRDVGLPGAYCVYAAIVTYCLVVVWFILPETKDRTLQDIEDEFKGKPSDSLAKDVNVVVQNSTSITPKP